ncbi:MAG: hypothetical protein Q8M16_14590 [Pirellulaceae bacterium]|nr:hypothetical protein [Pirellulaceae bacterium]
MKRSLGATCPKSSTVYLASSREYRYPLGLEKGDYHSSPQEPEAVRVDVATFSELLISKRDLKRSDSPSSNQLGLYDNGSGVRYVINEADLYLATH